ncbi:MAG TPA: PAS domain-containing protein [Victivallales bacterium]|nr:PAS domain-containing protein [Victivallales bacterium]
MKFYREQFRNIRKKKKISLKYVTNQIGKSYRTLLAWEKGELTPGESDIRILAQILSVNINEISNLEDFDQTKKPYYYNSLNELDVVSREFSGDLSIEQKTYILKLRSELEHLSSEIKMLKRTNAKQKNIIDSLHEFIYTKDSKLKFTDANPALLAYLEISLHEIIGKNNHDLFHSKEIENLTLIEKHALNTGMRMMNKEITIPGSNGKKRGIFSVSPIHGENDKVTGLVCSLKDISPFVTADKRMAMMEDVINRLTESVWITSLKPVNHFLFISKSIVNIFGRTPDEFYKNHKLWQEIIHPEDKQLVLDRISSNTDKDFPRETTYRIIHKDGSIRWIESKSFKNYGDKENDIIFGIIRDITEEKNYETKQNLLFNVIDKFSEIVWIGNYDDEKNFNAQYVNKYACKKISGYTDVELINDSDKWFGNIVPEDRERVLSIGSNIKNYPYTLKYKIKRKDGKIATVNSRGFSGEHNLFYGFIQDITRNEKNIEIIQYFKDYINSQQSIFWIKKFRPIERFIFISDSIENMLGYKASEINAKFWRKKIIHPDDLPKIEQVHTQIYENMPSMKYNVLHKNGTVKLIEEIKYEPTNVADNSIRFGLFKEIDK